MNYGTGNGVLDSRKCLTYIDEFEQKLNGNQKVISLVSFTALMDHYINEIDKIYIKGKSIFQRFWYIKISKVEK